MAEALNDQAAKARIVAAALPDAAFDGWTLETLRLAAAKAGVTRAEARRLFPNGGADLAIAWSAICDARLLDALPGGFAQLKIREKIAAGVRARLLTMAEHRVAARKAGQLLANPVHAAAGARALWATSDAIWRAAGDTATDYNHYTKRALLSAVYAATLTTWLDDDSDGFAATWASLDERIAGVMQIEKVKGTVLGALARVPSPLGILGRLRYPAPRR